MCSKILCSKAVRAKKRTLEDLEKELEESSKKLKVMEQTVEESKVCNNIYNTLCDKFSQYFTG